MSTAAPPQNAPTVKQEEPAPVATAEGVDQAIYQLLDGLVEIGDRELSPETRFEELGLSSLMVVTLTFELEDRFGITIPTEYLGDFRTIAEARETVLQVIAKAKA